MPTKTLKKILVKPSMAAKSLTVDDLVGEPVKEVTPKPAVPINPVVPIVTAAATEALSVSNTSNNASQMVNSEANKVKPSFRSWPSDDKNIVKNMPVISKPQTRINQGIPSSATGTTAMGTSTYRAGRFYRDSYNGSHQMQDANVPTETVSGFLDIMSEGHGFLRPKFVASDRDIYISQSQIRKFNLRSGDEVAGQARQPKENERYFGLLKVEKVNNVEAEKLGVRPKFDELVPIYPKEMIKLEVGKDPISCRIIDLFAPIGFGQRGLIVSPPKAGKTTILKDIAKGIAENYPKVHLMAVLIGERPEEVTDLSRSIKGEVTASHFDESPSEQTKVAEIGLDRAKRLVELGHDVVILLDSITRLARAYNLTVNSSGRTLSGGFDPAALYPAKRFLGAARKNEGSGSLTIIGTALVDTGSRMDDLIYEEFKGTGNMELHLNRGLAERRIFPAIDIEKSGTRQEQLLFSEETLKKIVTLRNMLTLLNDGAERTMAIVERLNKSKSNSEFLKSLSKGG